ncbi:MAG: deoxyribodipyrimidine photo-lyase [Rhodospirillales bacterium]|nr:deoxyribodipyrimidine photo-lyase [Rhodospirillales bacterium]
MSAPVILWFRNDLRLADHPALQAALATGAPVLPLYVQDTQDRWALGAASRWWLHHSLAALTADLRARGADLLLRRGAAAEILPALAAEVGADIVFTGAPTEPAERARDRAVAEALQADGRALRRVRTTLLFPPETLRNRSGKPFAVYTPFAKACLAQPDPPPPSPAPKAIPHARRPAGDTLESWNLLPHQPDWAGGMRATWTPGEAGATARLAAFAGARAARYGSDRDRPDRDGTSMLSPHLHFGEVSPAQVWHATGRGQPVFIRELLWREFCHHLLWHHPTMPDAPLRAAFAAMPWRDDPAGLRAWQRGRTGIPLVDAGMRQLWEIGWMHNRVRMLVGSFLVKHLLLPWQEGERWFWDTLVDADLGNNAGGWQWIAGCGADAAPYFRVFNPVLQGRKFDPDGAYVRRWVPELARLDTRFIHAPWDAPASVLAEAGITLGRSYPHPIVDLMAGRDRALAAFATLPKG